MGTMTHCLSISALPKEEKDHIRGLAKRLREDDGLSPNEASLQAAESVLAEYTSELTAIQNQVTEAGGVVPDEWLLPVEEMEVTRVEETKPQPTREDKATKRVAKKKDKPLYAKEEPAISADEYSKNFARWAGGNNVRVLESDEVNDYEYRANTPVVLKVFHGTTHKFDAFEAHRKGTMEGQFGRVNYFTSDEYDAAQNYAGEGPDLTNRIEQRAESIVDDIQEEIEESGLDSVINKYGLDIYGPMDDPDVIARHVASDELSGGYDQTMELFIKVENPFVIGENAQWIDLVDNEAIQEQAIMRVAEEHDIEPADVEKNIEEYEDEVDEARWEIEADTPNELIEAIQTVSDRHGVEAPNLAASVYDFGESARPEDIESLMRSSEDYAYAEGDMGELIGYQMISEVIEEMGFDSIILRNAEDRFKNMNMEQGTAHVHIFDSNNTNIKSVENVGTFSPTDPRILYAKDKKTKGLPVTEVESGLSKLLGKRTFDKLTDKLDLVIVQKQSELPGTHAGTVRAFHDPNAQRSYLVTDNIPNVDAAFGALLHDVGVHHGLRGMVGEAKYANLIKELHRLDKAGNKAVQKAKARVPSDTLDQYMDQEILGYLVEDKANRNMSLVKKIIAAIRQFLFRIGIKQTVSVEDIVMMARAAVYSVARGRHAYVSPAEGLTPAYHKAWHGSPHKLDKFSEEGIGTGEGAAAYGWGLYFADRKEVAEWYRENISLSFAENEAEETANYFIERAEGDRKLAAADLRYAASNSEGKDSARYAAAAAFIENGGNKGGLYEVELAPEQDEYLLWDKPLSEQSEKVREAIERLPHYDRSLDGGKFYDSLSSEMRSKGGNKHVSKLMHSLGIRGIKYLDGSSRAKGEGAYNYVIFSEEDIDITGMYSKVPDEEPEINIPPEGKRPLAEMPRTKKALDNLADGFIYQFVNRFKDLTDIQNELGDIPESQDAALAEELFSGRSRKRLDDLDDFHVRPLLEAIDKSKLSLEDVGRYLHARHAQEANKILKERNPEREDNNALSGMSDAEAKKILTEFRKNPDIKGIARKVDAINKERLEKLVDDGLVAQGQIDSWESMYQHYIPLHREQVNSEESLLGDLPPTGSGFHIAGKESKIRAGSTKEVDHKLVIPHIVANYEASAIRGEKNLVNQTLLDLVQNHPDPDLWTVDTYDTYVELNKDGVVVKKPDTRMHDNELGVKVDGALHRISFNKDNPKAMRLVKEMKNLHNREMPKFLRHVHTLMRFLSAINTSYNPEFVISNFARDIQTAGYNLGDTDIDGLQKVVLRDAVKHGIRGMWQNLRHKHDSEWAKYADEFERAGGMVGWLDNYDSIHDRAKAIEKEMEVVGKGKTPRKAIRAITDFVADVNGSIENAVRLSSFVHARRAGISAKKAAFLAKNLTVNFNRKGASSQYFNLAYLFFNASVQGSARMLSAVSRSKKVRGMVGATIGMTVALDLLNRALSGEDEDDRKYYDKIPDSVKDRNLIVFYGEGPSDYFKFPLPWGYNIFHVMGQMIGRGVDSDQIQGYSAAKEMARLSSAMTEAFNPMSAGSFLQSISPTLLDPAVKVAENKEWHGGPLMPETNPFGPPTPRSQQYFRSASEQSKWIASELNELTGGNKVRPGWWDWSPEWFDMIVGDALGGSGTFVMKVSDTAQRAYSGEEVETKNIPFMRKLLGSEYPSADFELYFERISDLEILKNELKEYTGAEHQAIRRRHADKIKMLSLAKYTQKRLRGMRKRKRVLESRNAPKDAIKAIDDMILLEMKRFNKKYQEVTNP